MTTVDSYANQWRLDDAGGVLLRPAGASTWQPVPADPAEGWQVLQVDQVGFIWIGGPKGLRRLDPHNSDAGWLTPASIPAGAVTALGLSAGGLTLAGFSTGEIVEVDIDNQGQTLAVPLAPAPEAIEQLLCQADGSLEISTATQRTLRPAPADAWQRHWRALAPLPGGNHDLFAIASDGRLLMAGGLTSGRGYPPHTHVYDELFAYDPGSDTWDVVSRMPFARCYSGIAEFDGRIWVIGGAANLSSPDDPDGPRQPLADVRCFDPASGTWSQGPAMNHARLECVVLTAAGRIWALGGSNGKPMDSVESIGLGENAWRPEPSLPWPQNQADGCVLQDRLYCMSRAGFLCFDTATRCWCTDLPQLESSPQAAQVAAFGGQVWVMGGSRRRDTHVYDPVERRWTAGPDLPTDNSWGAAVDLQGCLVIAGGAHWSQRHARYHFTDQVIALRSDALAPGRPVSA